MITFCRFAGDKDVLLSGNRKTYSFMWREVYLISCGEKDALLPVERGVIACGNKDILFPVEIGVLDCGCGESVEKMR